MKTNLVVAVRVSLRILANATYAAVAPAPDEPKLLFTVARAPGAADALVRVRLARGVVRWQLYGQLFDQGPSMRGVPDPVLVGYESQVAQLESIPALSVHRLGPMRSGWKKKLAAADNSHAQWRGRLLDQDSGQPVRAKITLPTADMSARNGEHFENRPDGRFNCVVRTNGLIQMERNEALSDEWIPDQAFGSTSRIGQALLGTAGTTPCFVCARSANPKLPAIGRWFPPGSLIWAIRPGSMPPTNCRSAG